MENTYIVYADVADPSWTYHPKFGNINKHYTDPNNPHYNKEHSEDFFNKTVFQWGTFMIHLGFDQVLDFMIELNETHGIENFVIETTFMMY